MFFVPWLSFYLPFQLIPLIAHVKVGFNATSAARPFIRLFIWVTSTSIKSWTSFPPVILFICISFLKWSLSVDCSSLEGLVWLTSKLPRVASVWWWIRGGVKILVEICYILFTRGDQLSVVASLRSWWIDFINSKMIGAQNDATLALANRPIVWTRLRRWFQDAFGSIIRWVWPFLVAWVIASSMCTQRGHASVTLLELVWAVFKNPIRFMSWNIAVENSLSSTIVPIQILRTAWVSNT